MKFQCIGKTPFESEAESEAFRLRLPAATRPTRSYPCPICNGWHMTQRRDDVGRRRKARNKRYQSW